ncbi:hypothetical protein PIB30_093463 [Stylosanthes scabra]|uniref:Uncharacterized protein n=1 Tax=Stylosanthes scabra TaxID=79078 RepID=A0ABU6WWB3_9FABA|nr:hypothetical protein [Stylosanthes scabra]
MEAQGIPVTIANLAIHRHREEEMNQERVRHNQTAVVTHNTCAWDVIRGAWLQGSHLRQRPHVIRGAMASYVGSNTSNVQIFIKVNPIQVVRSQFHPLIKGLIGRIKI